MEDRNGEYVINRLCERIEFLGGLCHDSEIVNLLRSMDKYEIAQLCDLGRVSKWENEKIKELSK